jgi:dihydropteroate synthase
MHTRAEPKQRLQEPDRYDDVMGDVLAFLRERIELALGEGMAPEQLIVDGGPDFAKTPAQTVALLRRLEELHALERPVLLAVSRKDFIGALTGRTPADRGAGTLAAMAHGLDAGVHLLRLHDVAGAIDFLAVRAALRGEREIPADVSLAEELRHESPRP